MFNGDDPIEPLIHDGIVPTDEAIAKLDADILVRAGTSRSCKSLTQQIIAC
jgi:hypothetical protein